jgi:uncharacterized protein
MIERLLARRVPVLAVSACLILLSAYGATSLTIDPNNRVFFSERHSKYSDLIDLESKFGSNTHLVFVVSSADPFYESKILVEAIEWLTDQLWAVQRVVGVESLATHPHASSDGDGLVLQSLLAYVCPPNDTCSKNRFEDVNKAHINHRIISSDARSASIVAKVDLHDPSATDVMTIADAAKELQAHARARYPDLEFRLTGGVPMMESFYSAAREDSERLMPIALVVLAACLYVFLGGVVQTGLLLALGLLAVTVTMGLAGWLGITVNTATATVPLIVFTLVIASAMHFFVHVTKDGAAEDHETVLRRVKMALGSNAVPVFLTALTTAVGLASMVFVSAPPIRQVGLLSALGVMVGAALTLTVVPCVFACRAKIAEAKPMLGLQGALNRYAKWMEHNEPRMLVMTALLVISILGLTRITIDEDFVRYFAADSTFRLETEEITGKLAGPYHIDIVYDSGHSAGIYTPESVADVSAIAANLRRDQRVVNVLSIVDVFESIHRVLSDGMSTGPWSSDELAQYFLSYELSLDRGQSTQDLVDSDHRYTRISVMLDDVSMGDIRKLVEQTVDWGHANGLHDRMVVTGEGVPTAYLSSESIREMWVGIVVTMVVSAFVVSMVFRDLRVALVIFSATVVPILAGFGVWGWFQRDIGMAATLVVAISIGVVIDDTIHLTYRYIDGRRSLDLTKWGAVAYSIYKTGSALVVTTVALATGLSVLLFSKFTMNSTFGLCASLIVAIALIYNLTVAPRLLRMAS